MIGTATTARGRQARYFSREDTSDASLVAGIVTEDEYRLADLPSLSGWAIDIGAHIGTIAVALAIDHPDLSVVAVEALPENVAVLRQNVDLNGLSKRVHIHEAAAASEEEYDRGASVPITYGWSSSINQPDNYMHDARFIGGMVGPNETSTTIACSALSLRAILDCYDITDVELLKIDCEGCEWFFLTSPEIARVRLIYGEMHTGSHGQLADLHRLLDPTHDVTVEKPWDSVTLFRAVRRG